MAMKTQAQAWAAVLGSAWLGGTPNSDNGNFTLLPGVNKGKALAGDDHVFGNNNANAIQGDAQKCLDAGMSDYVAKPVRAADLAAVLKRWLPA